MLKNINWPEDRIYRSETDNEPFTFYVDCLFNSKNLDLLLGYFSSSAISVLCDGFASFLYTGGSVRMVINNFLSDKDKLAIQRGKEGNIPDLLVNLNDIKALRKSLDEYGTHFFECLSWLIANKRIQIKIIRPKDGSGISHYKSGIFSDSEDRVGFNASCNFTAFGLLENLEKLTCNLSWDDQRSYNLVEQEARYFEKIFSGKAEFAEYLDIDNVVVAISQTFPNKDINELLVKEKDLKEKRKRKLANRVISESQQKAFIKIDEISKEPHFPRLKSPRNYQDQAYRSWQENFHQGIFAMATGTGKTITALYCILGEFEKTKNYQVVIVVPTNVLVEQWERDCRQFNFTELVKISSKHAGWEKTLDQITTQIAFGIEPNFMLITTYSTFGKSKFQEYMRKFSDNTILIADEAHNLGSPNVLKVTKDFKLRKRIGLSATPKRIYDDEGSMKVEQFFNDKEPYIFSFSMERAIAEGILCQYYYYPKIITLIPEELEEYSAITKQLSKYIGRNGLENNSFVEKLLMDRKRIIHRANNKLVGFKEIVEGIISKRGSIEYTLIYAPEGYFSDDLYFSDDTFPDLTEENRIIDYYSSIARKLSPDTTMTQYTSTSTDKEYNLRLFEEGKINVLLSMKCLDEGVDIPRTEQAIFCSSTGNPRQFIQRRGRILRKHPKKSFAYIHDLIVVPNRKWSSEEFKVEQNLVKGELQRVAHFAYMSINRYEALKELQGVCELYELNLDTIHLELTTA